MICFLHLIYPRGLELLPAAALDFSLSGEESTRRSVTGLARLRGFTTPSLPTRLWIQLSRRHFKRVLPIRFAVANHGESAKTG